MNQQHKLARSEACRRYYQKHKEVIAAKAKIYHSINPEKRKSIQKKSEDKNKEKIRLRRKNRYLLEPGFNKEYQKSYYAKEENKEKRRIRDKKRYHEDIQYKLKVSLRRTFRMILKGQLKTESVLQLIGCSIEELRNHIAYQFAEGMSWKNWGIGHNKWNIDHIKPIVLFDMSKESDRKACWNYTNLRPLWSSENLNKSDRLPDGTLARHRKEVSP